MSPQSSPEKGIRSSLCGTRVPESIPVRIDFKAITQLLTQAQAQGRDFLFEHETYALLNHSGAETPPRTRCWPRAAGPRTRI